MKAVLGARFFLFCACAALAACPSVCRADVLTLVSGRVYEGEVMIETKESIVFRTDNTFMTIPRREIESLVRSSAPAPVEQPRRAPSAPRRFVATIYVPQGPLTDLVVRVGSGGVTRSEYAKFLQQEARAAGKSVSELSGEERRRALERAIEEEMLFQGALVAGLHNTTSLRQALIASCRERHTAGRVKPDDVSEGELRAYYEAHKESFVKPPGVRVKMRRFGPGVPRPEIAAAWEAARTNPVEATGWKEFGWVRPGTEIEQLMRADVEYLLTLQSNEVSKLITDAFGTSFMFWVVEREEREARAYEDVREEILKRVIQERRERLEAEFAREMEAQRGPLSMDDAIFQRALEEGIHREEALRRQLIELYLSTKNVSRDHLLADLRAMFPVRRPEAE